MIPELQTFGEQERLEPLALVQVAFQPHPGGVQGNPLREGDQGLHVQLVEPLPVLLYFRQGKSLVELVELVLVGLLVDGLLVDEGFEQLVLAALELGDVALGGGPLGRDVLLPGVPDVEGDPPEELEQLGPRAELIQQANEPALQLGPRNVRPAAMRLRRAVIVGVALPHLALRPGAGERLAAVAAGHEATQREVRIVALLGHDQTIGAEVALAPPEDVFFDQRRPVAGGIDAPGGLIDAADVEPV